MLSRRCNLIALLVAAAPAFALGAAVPLHAAPAKSILVIVTQKESALAELSLRELKRLFTSEEVTGPDGTRVVPLNHPSGSPTRMAFDRLVLKMSPDEVGRFWIDRKIRGQTGSPKAIPSVEVLRRAVATLAGTVTYLNLNDVTADLKVVNVEGKRPTDKDYALGVE
jgi:hypothetical protein